MTDLTETRPVHHFGADHLLLAAAALTAVVITVAASIGGSVLFAAVDVAAVTTVVLAWFTALDAVERPWARPAATVIAALALVVTLVSGAHALVALAGVVAGLPTSPSRLVRAGAGVAMFAVAGIAAM